MQNVGGLSLLFKFTVGAFARAGIIPKLKPSELHRTG